MSKWINVLNIFSATAYLLLPTAAAAEAAPAKREKTNECGGA